MKIQELLEKTPSFFDLPLEDEIEGPFYHGTSTNLDIEDKLLPPDMTDTIAEIGRKKNLDKVFFTSDYRSAHIYAQKATKAFGGQPIVYRVHPVGEIEIVQQKAGTTVYAAPWAYVEEMENIT